MIKITGGQRIDLLGVTQGAAARRSGRSSGCRPATPTRRRCARSRPASAPTSAASASATRSASASSSSARWRACTRRTRSRRAVTGCPRNCAEAYVKDIGLVAVEGGWEVYVGGAAGGDRAQGRPARARSRPPTRRSARRARLPAALPRARGVPRAHLRLHRARRHRGRCARPCSTETSDALLERYRIAKAAADPDPWRERHDPVHPKQFSELDSEPDARRSARGGPDDAAIASRPGPSSAASTTCRCSRAARVDGRRPPRSRSSALPDGFAAIDAALPARGRAAGRRDRRRPLRDLPAARPALRPAHRRGARTAPTSRVHDVRERDGALWLRPTVLAVRRERVRRRPCPYCGVGCGLVARGRATAGSSPSRGDTAAPGQPRRDLPQADCACPRPSTRPTARRRRCGATSLRRALAAGAPGARRSATLGATTPAALRARRDRVLHLRPAADRGLLRGQQAGQGLPRHQQRRLELAPVHVQRGRRLHGRARAPTGRRRPTPTSTQADCLLAARLQHRGLPPDRVDADPRRQPRARTLIVVDPRRTPTAEHADLHLPVRPGTDLPLLNAMLTCSTRDGLLDRAFLDAPHRGRRGGAGGRRRLAARARRRGVRRAGRATSSRRRARFGARASARWRCGRWAPTSRRSARSRTGRSINLCLATGNIGRPGTGPLSLTGQPNAMGGRETGGLAHLLPGYRKVADAEDRAEMRRLWELAGRSAAGAGPGRDRAGRGARGRPRARCVWIVATNPVVSQPDAGALRRGAAPRRARGRARTPTTRPRPARSRTSILPAAQWPEKDGTMTNSERRVVARAARARPARRGAAGLGDLRPRRAARSATARRSRGARAAAVHAEYVATTAGRLCDQTGISHARLRREGPMQWPCPSADAPRHRAAVRGAALRHRRRPRAPRADAARRARRRARRRLPARR